MAFTQRHFSLRAFFGLIAVCGLVSVIVPCLITGYHDLHTCALCRTNRIDYIYEGRTWGSSVTETSCTRWYRKHVEPEHEHVWVRARASALRNLYGQRFGAIDRDPPGRGIWSITPEDQTAVYENMPDPIQGKQLFLSLTAASMMVTNQDYEVLRALQAW